MVLLSILVVIVARICCHQVNGDCQTVDWSHSFKQETLSECYQYIRGFHVNGKEGGRNIDIGLIEGVECCAPLYPWDSSKPQTVHVNWWYAFDSRGRVSCPEGFFLSGLRRTLASPGRLSNIEEGRCTKPADHPHYYNEDCLNIDISGCTSGKGLCKCPDNYFVVGLGRDECNELRCLSRLKCCQMWDKPKIFSEIDEVKERIMDITHSNLALLGHYLGYGWTGGCMEPYVGEGYKRVGDTMEADESFRCQGYKNDHRLNLAFGNWRFEMKNITKGERVIEILNPESIDSGIVINNDSREATKEVEITSTITREVTHSVENAWKEAHSLGFEFSYMTLASTSYSFHYERTKTVYNSSNQREEKIFKSKLSKTLEPYSKKKWSIILTKTRATLPYTAVIGVKFSVDFQGFLRWGGGYHGQDTNYHQNYRGSGDRPTFHYQFGDASEPFYSALKRQSCRNSAPWQWHEMKEKYPYLRPLIDDLTKESHYEFTLSGKFEDVMGTDTVSRWDDVTKSKRDSLISGSPSYQVLEGFHVARPGPDDVRGKVLPPKIFLDNAKLCDFDVPLNISTFI